MVVRCGSPCVPLPSTPTPATLSRKADFPDPSPLQILSMAPQPTGRATPRRVAISLTRVSSLLPSRWVSGRVYSNSPEAESVSETSFQDTETRTLECGSSDRNPHDRLLDPHQCSDVYRQAWDPFSPPRRRGAEVRDSKLLLGGKVNWGAGGVSRRSLCALPRLRQCRRT